MNDYQKEQIEGLKLVLAAMQCLSESDQMTLRSDMNAYLDFREELNTFTDSHFSAHCSQDCFENARSACCGKDGIVTFWADMVINVCHSTPPQVEELFNALMHPLFPDKCVYLSPQGCLWQMRPLGCAMFLCDAVQETVFERQPLARSQWEAFKGRARSFRWPDQPVLFDKIERLFMAQGYRSPLMYLNTSPGLLRVKQRAQRPWTGLNR